MQMPTSINLFPESGKRIRLYVLAGVLLLAVLALVLPRCSKPPAVNQWGAVPESPRVSDVAKKEVQSKVKSYDKKEATKKLGMPAGTVAPDEEIITTGEVKPSQGGATVATVLDTKTGESRQVIEYHPRPLLALGGELAIGVRAGITARGEEAQIYIRKDVLRVGPVYLAGYGEVSATATAQVNAKAMIDVSMRF